MPHLFVVGVVGVFIRLPTHNINSHPTTIVHRKQPELLEVLLDTDYHADYLYELDGVVLVEEELGGVAGVDVIAGGAIGKPAVEVIWLVGEGVVDVVGG